MIKDIIFWCEFPNKLDFKKLEDISFPCSIYFASKNKNEFLKYKNQVKNEKIKVGVWPLLSKKQGYWFSSFSSEKSIDKLKEFQGISMKIDIEPPLPDFSFNYFKFALYLIKYAFKKGENHEYLNQTIKELSKDTNIIQSTYPFPNWVLKNYGLDKEQKTKFNYFLYPSMFSNFLKHFIWRYYQTITNNKDYFALGLISKGIFGNEPTYKSIKEFEKDLQIFKKLNLENIVIYSIEGLLNQNNYKEWLSLLK